MSILQIILAVFSGLPALVQAVESIYSAIKGSGALKKQAVLSVASTVVDTIAAIPGNSATAAQKDAILGLASTATDALVNVYNAVGVFVKAPPIAVDQGSGR